MHDNQLLQDIDAAYKHPSENYDWLSENEITTYSQLFAFIKDENADPETRNKACWALSRLGKSIDKRKAVPSLLAALQSNHDEVREGAIWALGCLQSKRAVLPLLTILADRIQTEAVRVRAVDALSSIEDPRAVPVFKQLIYDPTEDIIIRGDAIEWLREKPEPIQEFIQLLSHPEADIRFWAAYRLSSSYLDVSPALEQLDQLVADDHRLPFGFGWQVSREAMLPLETVYYRKIVPSPEDDEYHWYGHGPMHLISPAPEYSTLLWLFRHWTENATYTTDPLPDIKLNIDPDWLAEALKTKWPEIRLNVRQPRPQAYLLDWHLQIGAEHLIGALHRDQYAVTLTGKNDLMVAFATWYRTLFPDEQHLYLYQWADVHVELKPGMSAKDIEKASDRPSVSAKDIIAEDLMFG
jgi:hypothetical protein